MNYPESKQILQLIKQADRVLVNCHSRPDADSVGSALAMSKYLEKLGKEVLVVCPDDLPSSLEFLKDSYDLNFQKINFSSFDFNTWGLFLCLDSADWKRVTANPKVQKPDLDIVVIDHHKTNTKYGNINLIDPGIAATGQLLYKLFSDFEFTDYDKNLASGMLTAIFGDTGALSFPEADEETLRVVLHLIKLADKNEIIFNLYQKYELRSVELWGEIMKNMQINSQYRYIWAAIDKDTFSQYGSPAGSKSEIADIFFQSINNTDFGMVIVEESDGYVSVSLRSRTGFDVSQIAQKLDGGGHRWAAAGRVYGKPINEALQYIHEVVQKQVAKSS